MGANRQVFRFGPNVTPNRVVTELRPDGKTNVFYSNKGGCGHGHTVIGAAGLIVYARTRGGNVLKGS